MEERDMELIKKYSVTDEELKSLWEDHVLYQKQVDKLESRPYRTPVEEQTLKQLKKQKLEGKTRLESLLGKYRNAI
jgi:uncharacterized protein YdcH (DUF465 family)